MDLLRGLDLFSGIGGITIALGEWVRPVAYSERDPFCQAVLLQRMRTGDLPRAAIWDDVTTLRAEVLPPVDIIYGGFPCQDISVAGNGAGLEGKRSGLFFEVARLVSEVKPTFVFLENVPAIRSRGAYRVCNELASRGYDCRWDVVSAAEVGAPHLRKRWFLLAYSDRKRREEHQEPDCKALPRSQVQSGNNSDGLRDTLPYSDGRELRYGEQRSTRRRDDLQASRQALPGVDGQEEPVAHTDRSRLEVGQSWNSRKLASTFRSSWWESEPDVGRVAAGIPLRVDRLRGLGNSVCPLQAREAFKRLIGFKEK